MIGPGSRQTSLKGDANEDSVTLELNGETYTRTLRRRGGTVTFDGDPYLDDPGLANLFAFILEGNEARWAVARDGDLREIIMRPIDTDSIDTKIRECKREREELESEIKRLDSLERDLSDLEADRHEKVAELETAQDELASAREEIDELDVGVDKSRTRRQEIEEAFQQVRDARSKLDDLEFDLEAKRSTLAKMHSEREELRETIEAAEAPEKDPDRLAGRIGELQRRKRSLDDDINQPGSVIGFNEDMVDSSGINIEGDAPSDSPTATLIRDEQATCWTCGSAVESGQNEATLDRLRELRSAKLDERNEVRAEIQQLTDEQSAIREAQREIERATDQLASVEAEIESTESRGDDLGAQIKAKRETMREREKAAESINVEGYDEALQLRREANGIERLEDKIDDIDAKIDEREATLKRREKLRADREAIADRLIGLRTRVNCIEENAVEEFNDNMATVLNTLEYENLDRIWIERQEAEVREGRRKVTQTRFDLHIVRSSPDGTAYEDTVDHFSESERFTPEFTISVRERAVFR